MVVAAVVWWWATRSLRDGDTDDTDATDDTDDTDDSAAASAEPVDASPRWWRRPIVWWLTIAFSGQAFAYYGTTAWLPSCWPTSSG